MKLTFVSNYINHHQIPVSNELYKKLGEDYCFIQTEPIEQERLQMGWQDETKEIPYLRCYYEQPETCRQLILDSDVVVFGGTDDESYIQPRLKAGKLVIRYSERLYKTGQWKAVSPRGLKKKYEDHTKYRNAQVYLLCAGGYVSSDFHIVRAYPNKMLKWGYFPKTRQIDMDKTMLLKQEVAKQKDKVTLLWAGRFIDWKHPELPIELAKYLKEKGYKFELRMIGGGDMLQEIQRLLKEYRLEDYVKLVGYMTPEEVREQMEETQIYLFTSDYQEGWGAVLNEAMNSGCAVVASHAIGATPYLIQHEKNGLIFKSGDVFDLVKQTEKLLMDQGLCEKLGRAAVDTILSQWNAENAANRLVDIAEKLLAGQDLIFSEKGPCSKAEIIAERKMYRYLCKD
ncbi:MAG: glycosyltransferase [Lachnospiraceae bacterium]|nr:glycosyltransferase [Lachnospiraceae bacterium]